MPTVMHNGRLVLRLPQALVDRLAELARAADRTLAAEVRRALRAHVERESEQEKREERRA
jgi:predicted transcriptional regulator